MISRPHLLRFFVLTLLLLLSACAGLRPKFAGPALWRVESQHEDQTETLWLFGTIHRLPNFQLSSKTLKNLTGTRLFNLPHYSWSTIQLRQAVQKVDNLYVEILPLQGADLAKTLATELAVADSQTQPLQEVLDEAQYQQILEAAARRGITEEVIDRADPLLAFTLFANMPPQQSRRQEVGADVWLLLYANNLHKPVHGLEVLQDRILAIKHAISRLHGADQAQVLLQFLRTEASEVDSSDASYQAMYEYWLDGNVAVFDRSLRQHAAELPEIHEAFTAARNYHWIETLDELLHNGEDEFIAVGMAHVAGPDNLIELLESRGYQVERVQ